MEIINKRAKGTCYEEKILFVFMWVIIVFTYLVYILLVEIFWGIGVSDPWEKNKQKWKKEISL